MAKIMKKNYAIILFLSLFLLASEVNAFVECYYNIDCPQMCYANFVIKCINEKCLCVQKDVSVP
ncbi:unnamed protein product [Trifolium pratense]|uniref:Uncharacterized protein n=1 Tax=Trifolium pratense TaxID=57577 RepID=A0ACB0LZB2_TRIPR|nr:unnamed protein product [Trifolium pratense]